MIQLLDMHGSQALEFEVTKRGKQVFVHLILINEKGTRAYPQLDPVLEPVLEKVFYGLLTGTGEHFLSGMYSVNRWYQK